MIPVSPRTFEHLWSWCAQYQESGIVPQPRHIRFAIGIYQISQGMAWRLDAPVRWQSFCSASMHFMMAASAYGVDLTPDFPERLEDIDTCFSGWDRLLMAIGRVQQQIIYALHSGGTSRASRFKPEELRECMRVLVSLCFACTPPEYREQGCFDEMHIICKDLAKRA